MKYTVLILLLFMTLLGYCLSNANPLPPDKTVIWQRQPIQINLTVGKERLISFPTAIRFGYSPNRLPPSVLRVQNLHSTLYLRAAQPFAPQRAEVTLSSGEVILVDIQASNTAQDNRPIDVLLQQTRHANPDASEITPITSKRLTAVTLTRYALQQLYAPPRLLTHSTTIQRFPMETRHIVPLMTDTAAIAMPLASWRQAGWYVTAVELKNQLPQAIMIQPQQLCGHWQTVSFYPRQRLLAQGTQNLQDTTTAFLVSTQPFSQAMHPCDLPNGSSN